MTLEEEKNLVSKTLLGWDKCMHNFWNPQDPDKATYKEWQDIYTKMTPDMMTDYIYKLINLYDTSNTVGDQQIFIHTVSVVKRWKVLVLVLTEFKRKHGYILN